MNENDKTTNPHEQEVKSQLALFKKDCGVFWLRGQGTQKKNFALDAKNTWNFKVLHQQRVQEEELSRKEVYRVDSERQIKCVR